MTSPNKPAPSVAPAVVAPSITPKQVASSDRTQQPAPPNPGAGSKTPNHFTWLRKVSRVLHRDLSFFFAGMIVIYALSGIVLNHRDTLNPHYAVNRHTYTVEHELGTKQTLTEAQVLRLLEPLGEAERMTKYYFPTPNQLKVFLKGGSSLVVQLDTRQAVYEQLKRRPLISPMVQLHFNPGKGWTWFADAFAVGLILITLSGICMLPGKKGISGRGGLEMLVGMLIPLLFLFFFH